MKIVETAGRSPEPYMPTFKAAGINVIHKCTSVRHALTAERLGVDAISIDGFECAGHPGEDDIPGLILFPAAADKLKIPIVASGGIGDARGLVAALALGADGINMGTRFMATQEAPVHPNMKQAMVDGDERQTQLIFRTLRNTARVFKNGPAVKVAEIEAKGGATIQDLEPYVAGVKGRLVMADGDMEAATWTAGMVIGLIHDIPSVQELITRIVTEAEAIMRKRLPSLLV